jgi:hypothetical protein
MASEQNSNKISKYNAWVEVLLKFYLLFKEKRNKNSIDKLTLFYTLYIL